jgi:hypothetical protein
VNVNSVQSWREFCHINVNTHTALGRGKGGRADFLAGGVNNVSVCGLCELRARRRLLLLRWFGIALWIRLSFGRLENCAREKHDGKDKDRVRLHGTSKR